MSSFEKSMLPDESIIFSTKKHLIIFLVPAFWTLFSFFATYYMEYNPILARIVWTPWLVAAILWAYVGLEYVTSKYMVTNKRVIMREGFFNRHIAELRISAIAQINVDQSLIGRMLDYGTIRLNAFGAYDAFPLLAKPYNFQGAVNQELDKLTR